MQKRKDVLGELFLKLYFLQQDRDRAWRTSQCDEAQSAVERCCDEINEELRLSDRSFVESN